MKLWAMLASTGVALATLAAATTFNAALTPGDTARPAAQINAADPPDSARVGVAIATPGRIADEGLGLATAAGIGVVVIDAGHGGRDLGCSGTTHGAREKHIALSLALQLGERLASAHPDIQVVYTRESDVFVPLHRRAAIANEAQADLFISLHCNALPSASRVRGSETYVMGLHTAQHNLDVAKRENAAIHLEQDPSHHYDFDPESPAGHITLSMFQHAFLEQSMRLADDIETALGSRPGHRSRGVKQAGFLVLKETAMPSVLVETGYLTNASEEAYLNSEDGRAETVEALYTGVRDYLRQRRRDAGAAQAVPVSARIPREQAPAPQTPEQRLRGISEPGAHIVAPVGRRSATPGAPARPEVVSERRSLAASVAEAPASPVATEPSRAVHFYVQLAASTKPLDVSRGKWASLGHPIRGVAEGIYTKYQAGPFATFAEADRVKRTARAGAFPDAFTTGYRDGVKLSRAGLEKVR